MAFIGTHYSGPATHFPKEETWLDYDTLFSLNERSMLIAGDTSMDTHSLHDAIMEAAVSTGIDERVVLCIVMQESHGNVGVAHTVGADGKADSGVMQAEESPDFGGQHNLSEDQVSQMVMAGAQHFLGVYESMVHTSDQSDPAFAYYDALRMYNTGNIDHNDLSNGMGATGSYVSDMVNRLQGVVN